MPHSFSPQLGKCDLEPATSPSKDSPAPSNKVLLLLVVILPCQEYTREREQEQEQEQVKMHQSVCLVAPALLAGTGASCGIQPFENLVAFGDSYTDNGRLNYYLSHNNTAPPAGTLPPVSTVSISGGLTWGQFVQQYTGVAYFDYAISGATCSNDIVSRYASTLGGPYPSVVENELPSFVADVDAQTLYANRTAANTVYALWIGTNDLGYAGFLTDSQAPGVSVS